jgi:hypothetical protein
VGRHDDHGTAVRLGAQQVEHAAPVRMIELGGGLVGEEDRRLGGEATRHGDALLLPAGQLLDEVVTGLCQADVGQRGGGSDGDLSGANPGGQERKGDILTSGEHPREPVALRDEATPARTAVVRSETRPPATVTSPATGRTAPAIVHSSDDLPAPDGPVSASRLPGGTTRSTSSTARTDP